MSTMGSCFAMASETESPPGLVTIRSAALMSRSISLEKPSTVRRLTVESDSTRAFSFSLLPQTTTIWKSMGRRSRRSMALSTSPCPMEPPSSDGRHVRDAGAARASALSIALLTWVDRMPMGRMMRSGMPACTM